MMGVNRERRKLFITSPEHLAVCAANDKAHREWMEERYPLTFSCICMTHGRPWLLEEAIESYRRQQPGPFRSELVILNDCPEQTLVCDIPGVRIIQGMEPYLDLSLKTNRIIEDAQGRWLVWWDDDDISLPLRLRQGWEAIQADPDAMLIRENEVWSWHHKEITGISATNLASGIVNRNVAIACGGCEAGVVNDRSLIGNIERCKFKTALISREPDKVDYIYRWSGIGHHDSGAVGKTSLDRAREFQEEVRKDSRFRHGQVTVSPQWGQDYEQLAYEASERIRKA